MSLLLCQLVAASFKHAFYITLNPFAACDHIDTFCLLNGDSFDRITHTDLDILSGDVCRLPYPTYERMPSEVSWKSAG